MKEVGISPVIIYNGFHMAGKQKESKRKAGDESHEERFLKAFDEYADALFRHSRFTCEPVLATRNAAVSGYC